MDNEVGVTTITPPNETWKEYRPKHALRWWLQPKRTLRWLHIGGGEEVEMMKMKVVAAGDMLVMLEAEVTSAAVRWWRRDGDDEVMVEMTWWMWHESEKTTWPIVVRHVCEKTAWPIVVRHAYVKMTWPSERPEWTKLVKRASLAWRLVGRQ
nr:hypothetical protein [Tanacetum cinerariifolium]